MPTIKDFIATGSSNFASSPVMLTSTQQMNHTVKFYKRFHHIMHTKTQIQTSSYIEMRRSKIHIVKYPIKTNKSQEKERELPKTHLPKIKSVICGAFH